MKSVLKFLLFLCLLGVPIALHAQVPAQPVALYGGTPPIGGACVVNATTPVGWITPAGQIATCQAGVWAYVGNAVGFVYIGNLAGIPAICTVGQVAFITDATPGQNQYNCTATNTWTQNLNSGSGGASTSLNNLSAVNINSALLAQTGIDAGSTTKPFRNIFLVGTGTYGTNYFEFTGAPTGTRVLTLPDATGTLLYSGGPLGTPSSGTATNLTGLPVSSGISGLGTGIATFLGTPSSVNLLAAMTTATGSGNLVFATSPTFINPALGTPASGVATNLTGLPISTGVSGLATGIATFLATPTSANLAAAITNETGTGLTVFNNGPTFIAPVLGTPASGNASNLTNLPITLTTTGTSGAATYTQSTNTLNVPQYSGSGSGCVPSGSAGVIQASNGSSACQNTSITDNGTIISTSEGIQTGVGGSVGGYYAFGQGTATTAPTSSVGFMAPATVTTKFMMTLPAAPVTGVLFSTGVTDPTMLSFLPPQGNGSKVQLSTGTTTTNDCVKFDANGNTVDAGGVCSGAGITALTGDVTASGTGSVAATVARVNGIAYSATAAAHSVEVITTANTIATSKVLPDCQDSGGSHLNYTQSSDAFSCGNTSSGGGASGVGIQSASVTFGAIPDGTCADQTFTFTGITTSTQLTPGWPSVLNAGLVGDMFASASNTVDVRLCNLSGASATPGTLTYVAKIANYYLTNSGTLTYSSIPDGGYSTQTLTLTGATAGDAVVLGPPAALTAGLLASAVATASNTITVTVQNLSGSAQTPSGTFTATIAK